MDNQQLFAVFVSKPSKNTVLKLIKANYEVPEERIFVLEDMNSENTLILTFNGYEKNNVNSDIPKVRNIINIHRKKDNNILYTVNALNELVKQEKGEVDLTYKIDWENEKYKNKFIITRNGELEFISTELKTIVKLEKVSEYKVNY